MSIANWKITQKLEAIIITMEMNVGKMRELSTSSYENTMNSAKVAAVHTKVDELENKLSVIHGLMEDAIASSTDDDVTARSGGGRGK